MKAKEHTQQSRWVAGSLIVASAVVMLVLLWFYTWAPPSKADFRAAESQADSLMEEMMRADSAASTYMDAVASSLRFEPNGGKIKTETKKQWSDFTSSMETYQAQLERLKRSPVSRDKEAAPLIDQISRDTARFRGFLNSLVAEYPTYYKTEIACDELKRFTESDQAIATAKEYQRVAKGCTASLSELSGSKLAPFSKYASEHATILKATERVYNDLAKQGANTASLNVELADLKAQASRLDPQADIRTMHDQIMNHKAFDDMTRLIKKRQ